MANKPEEKYEEQHIAVDIAILTSLDHTVQNLEVLLIRRRNDPFKDCRALPGGYLNADETLEQAAYRELQEETSLSAEELAGVSLHQFKAYGDPGRDPRCRIVSIVYYAIVPYSEKLLSAVEARDDAKDAKWLSLQNPPADMAFDHATILRNLFVAAVGGQLR